VTSRIPSVSPIEESTLTATPKFAHVVLQTRSLEQMRDWYCTVPDAHVVYEGHNLCFITFDEEHHRKVVQRPYSGASSVGRRCAQTV
jgi:catechol 2,3-dioxygenase-like lactoylglutathione lyase family enzyme